MKKTSVRLKTQNKNKIIGFLAVLIIIPGLFYGYKIFKQYRDAANQAIVVQPRKLVLSAIRGLSMNAPVEPRTGDVYFPESRVYLPNPKNNTTFIYNVNVNDNDNPQEELNISTYPVRGTVALYTATNIDKMFNAVPKVMACSRGIRLVYKKYPDTNAEYQLKNTLRLENGRELYIYLNKDCLELSDVAEMFNNIKSY